MIARPEDREYFVYFDLLGNGPFAPPEYIPLVGNGDCPRYNRPSGEDPIHALGLLPILADFNNDGAVDLVSRQIYSAAWGQPWFTIFFWANIGTNEKPVYADYVRLQADGKVIPNHYSGCDLYDWDGDGLLDLVTSKTVYRNTGKTTHKKAPVLTKLTDLTDPAAKGVTYRHFIGMHDHDQDGVSDAFYQLSKVHYVYEGPPPRNFVEGAFYRRKNSAAPGETPVLGEPEPLERAGKVWTEHYIPTDFCDMDHDGDLDMLGNSRPLDRIPPTAQFCYWPNEAPAGIPPVYGRPVLIPNAYNMGGYNIFRVRNAAYDGLLAIEGHRARYHEHVGTTLPGQMPGYADRGLLMQRNGRCGVDGYSSVDIADWEGDGDWDIIAGDEIGSIWLTKNIGNNARPVFETPHNIEANGEPMRIMRWHYMQDGNPEYWLGQTKPCYVDWDGDTDMDIISANNTNRVAFYENIGNRDMPEFTRSEVLRVGDDDKPFEMRSRLSVVDWDGDGEMDLITQAASKRTCLFRGYHENGEKKLHAPVELLDEAGNPFGARQVEVYDWDGDGDWDLLSQVGNWGKAGAGFHENTGTNAAPRFRTAKRLKCWGKEFTLSAHEHSFCAVDWYGTGTLDLICGGENGYFFFFRRPALDTDGPPKASVRMSNRPTRDVDGGDT